LYVCVGEERTHVSICKNEKRHDGVRELDPFLGSARLADTGSAQRALMAFAAATRPSLALASE